jgi:hypothetical protein
MKDIDDDLNYVSGILLANYDRVETLSNWHNYKAPELAVGGGNWPPLELYTDIVNAAPNFDIHCPALKVTDIFCTFQKPILPVVKSEIKITDYVLTSTLSQLKIPGVADLLPALPVFLMGSNQDVADLQQSTSDDEILEIPDAIFFDMSDASAAYVLSGEYGVN